MEENDKRHVEFVSYDGRFPNLCSGMLILRIDGEEVGFHYSSHDDFWKSGGEVGFDDNGDDVVKTGEWGLCEERVPDKYKKYAQEMIDVFNANVEFGCCGGCV